VNPDGVLLIDKPAGCTSHDVVALVKRALSAGGAGEGSSGPGERGSRLKVGHAGTLDPFATGLLIVLVGRATKAQQRLMELPKRYETVAQLGATSTTGDPEGEIARTGILPPDPPALPTGQIRQRPPRHSAVKIGGERAYKRARRGEQFELPERIVTVYRFTQLWREPEPDTDVQAPARGQATGDTGVQAPALGQASGDARALERAGYEIECSAGTYVRSLIADLRDAYCLQLRRTAIGPFEVRDAVTPPPRGDTWSEPPLIALDRALAALPT
jgi:tRNA pseudouridine55 synthase